MIVEPFISAVHIQVVGKLNLPISRSGLPMNARAVDAGSEVGCVIASVYVVTGQRETFMQVQVQNSFIKLA
jgi:hypothetical protein